MIVECIQARAHWEGSKLAASCLPRAGLRAQDRGLKEQLGRSRNVLRFGDRTLGGTPGQELGLLFPKLGLDGRRRGQARGEASPHGKADSGADNLHRVRWEAGSKVGTWGPGASRYKGGTEAKQNILQKAVGQYWTCLGTKSLRSLVSQPLQ